MSKITIFVFLFFILNSFDLKPDKFIARQGQVTFFSYTTAENIEATNNQALSILDLSKNEISISMLMNSFIFKKSLMHEHFNESYIESDLYPKATFHGKIIDFDRSNNEIQTRVIKGKLTIRNISKDVEIKTNIQNVDGEYIITGKFNIPVKDFNIKIPKIVEPNIAKVISTKFKFEYELYEK
jgi:YceI-like domain